MKRFQSIGLLLSVITGLLVVLLISVFAYSAKQAYDRREHAAELLKTVDVLSDVFAALEALRFEQGAMGTALAQPKPADAATRAKIEKLHETSLRTLEETHDKANVEADGTIPNLTRILRARRKLSRHICRSVDKPRPAIVGAATGPQWRLVRQHEYGCRRNQHAYPRAFHVYR